MEIDELTIIAGSGKNKEKEPVGRVNLKIGNIVSIVGPTGSGKTELINDIERFANENTPSKRKILIDGSTAPDEFKNDPSKNPIALITQHTNFLSDLPVYEFLSIHAGIRQSGKIESTINRTLDFANQLTGESIILENAMTELSGGQSRALLIADAVIIGNSPIILLDEIENAGIHRTKALELLKDYKKIFFFVTHDPRIALLSDFRIVMKNGAMQKLIEREDKEKRVAEEIKKIDDILSDCRTKIRAGESLNEVDFKNKMRALGYVS
jgi:ABC-type lipoprotein export system ATPase subunit